MAMLVITRGYLSTPVPRCTPCWIFSWWNHSNFLGFFLWWSYSHCPFWIMLNPQFSRLWLSSRLPIGSMYAIYDNIYHQYTVNVSIYTIHGSYGLWWSRVFPCFATFAGEFCRFLCPIFWWRHHTWLWSAAIGRGGPIVMGVGIFGTPLDLSSTPLVDD